MSIINREEAFVSYLYQNNPQVVDEISNAWRSGWETCRQQLKNYLTKHAYDHKDIQMTVDLKALMDFVWKEMEWNHLK